MDLVNDWLEAKPPNAKVDQDKLKTFLNIRLGQTWEEVGETPKINRLMQNTQDYPAGTVPDKTCDENGDGVIVMLTIACDLNGVMQDGNEDGRVDWELLAHTSQGASYSVDHGSIGTFKRKRDKTKIDRDWETGYG